MHDFLLFMGGFLAGVFVTFVSMGVVDYRRSVGRATGTARDGLGRR